MLTAISTNDPITGKLAPWKLVLCVALLGVGLVSCGGNVCKGSECSADGNGGGSTETTGGPTTFTELPSGQPGWATAYLYPEGYATFHLASEPFGCEKATDLLYEDCIWDLMFSATLTSQVQPGAIIDISAYNIMFMTCEIIASYTVGETLSIHTVDESYVTFDIKLLAPIDEASGSYQALNCPTD